VTNTSAYLGTQSETLGRYVYLGDFDRLEFEFHLAEIMRNVFNKHVLHS